MSTYLVTGAAGFIASKVCEFLLAEGHTVVGVDNLNDYYDVRLKDYRLTQLLGGSYSLSRDPKHSIFADNKEPISHNRFEFRVMDIENIHELEELFATRKFEAVFNLAARAGVRASLENPELYRRTNVLGEENVLKCQMKHGVKKHVVASSSSVYAGCSMPFAEDAMLGEPQSPYAGTKRQAELLALEYHEKHGLDVSALRYFTVFGPAGRPDMAPFRFVHWIATGQPIKLFGDGNQSRDFTCVDDIARGTVLAARLLGGQSTVAGGQPVTGGKLVGDVSEPRPRTLDPRPESETSGFQIINLGGGNRPITINAMIALLENYLGKKAVIERLPVNPVDMTDTQADITKAGRLLGWSPQISPEDGFRTTVEWYLANRAWLPDIRL